MQKRAPGAASAIDDLLGQGLKVVAVVVVFLANDVDQPSPSTAQADDLAAFPDGSDGDRADCWIQSRNVAAPSQDSDHAFFLADIRHCVVLNVGRSCFVVQEPTILLYRRIASVTCDWNRRRAV